MQRLTGKYEITEAAKKIFSNDKVVKAIAIPALGILIPNVSGLITNTAYSFWQLFFNYVCFILISWTIWQGNVHIMLWLKKNLKLSANNYYKSLLSLLLTVSIYTILISICSLLVWIYFSHEDKSHTDKLYFTILIIAAAALFITNLYESFYLNQEHTDTLYRVEQLNLAKTHAELVALKNQIDPHFIFNSLNTLSYLITSNPANAKLYNDTLAKVYHYILINKEKNLVLLRDELEFISNYFYLLKIRFDAAINMTIEINSLQAEDLLILPISLQILLENVMKHNEVDAEKPLVIRITVSSNYITVRNQIRLKSFATPTSKIGLTNLDNRYKLLTGKNILIYKTHETFAVKLPILNLKNESTYS